MNYNQTEGMTPHHAKEILRYFDDYLTKHHKPISHADPTLDGYEIESAKDAFHATLARYPEFAQWVDGLNISSEFLWLADDRQTLTARGLM